MELKQRALQTRVKKNGYDYLLLDSTETAAIYEQSFNGQVVGYEVFKRKSIRIEVFKGKEVVRKDFPRDNDFGKTAWAIRCKERAFARFREISSHVEPSIGSDTTCKVNSRYAFLEAK